MYQVKKKIISAILIVSALLMTAGVSVMGTNAVNVFKYGLNYDDPLTYNGEKSTFLSLTTSASTISYATGYATNCKYASCRSYHWNGIVATYISQDAAYSGYVTTNIANSANDHYLLVNNDTDKIAYYGELYSGSDQYSGKKDRFWVSRYRNEDMAHHDNIYTFDFS